MSKLLLVFIFFLTPIFGFQSIHYNNFVEMWWCKGCGYSYPITTKYCLNNKCPLYKQKRK